MQTTYTIKRGDTLYGISNQFGVSVSDLASINNININTPLQIGKTLIIPTNTGINPSNYITYTVKKGDSLYSIAKKYDTTVNELISINKLKNTNLSIGQKLQIPETYNNENSITLPNYINYTVKKGDTLYSIAKKYNITPDTIIKDNSLQSNTLSIGQNLKIRTTTQIVEECFGEEYIPPKEETTITYIVKKGDTLYSIAKKYNTTVESIKNKNNLKTNSLTIGQQLII
ncbi:MAG: LysM peptidoglycan-binding domain-containing protein [Bacilli bacterium]|nr:LysM peptidoglycan-binding domain-containing protein [Bacilli bacterium]